MREALREILEEQIMNEKAREKKIRQKQVDDDEYFMEFRVMRIDSDYEWIPISLTSVFLKVSPFRGVKRFGIKGKLSPRFIGPFEILERIGEVSYRLALPPQLSHVHDVFHVSLLRGYHYHPLHVASYPFDQIQPDMSLSEEPESILDRQERVMRNKVIPFVKILWKNHPEREATWETEESMRASSAGTSGTAPSTTTALSLTFVSTSTIPPISIDDYEVVHTDGQEGTDADGQTSKGADANPFPSIDDAELNVPE
ncbi:putative nucleotidyltransferase, ribonuclease H [Tanacetum coccineum]